MTGTVATQVKAIAFDRDIERLTEVFIGREWVFDDIDRWLKESEERFFILTGEPGVGKSAITARLTQIRNDVAAYHFCRAGDVETVRPGRILRSLAAQLGEYLPDYGQALANTIKPVHLRIEVNINIGSMTGSEVTGVYIENLKESDPENELDILIRAPLEKLQKMYAKRQQAQPALAIILIDSLDEAVTTTGTNLVKLLTQLSESPSLPSWVRFVMTSRPERRVLRGFKSLKPYHLREKSDESLADVRQYVEDRVAQSALQDRLQVNQVQPQTLISEITNLSHGNFLYTKLLLNDIEAGRQALDNLAALPKSIDDIYHGFLSRFSEEDWSERYKPIFGILTVAQEPISERQISNFTNIDSEDVRDSIRIARQFFDVEIDERNKETYSLFHQSLRDYLFNEDRNSDFWCNERKQHQRIIDFCGITSKSWQDLERIDAYGRKHLAQHLVKAERVEELHTLLSLEKDGKNAWFKVKDDKGELSDFLTDLEIAWAEVDNADERETGKSIGLQSRYAMMKASIKSLVEIPIPLIVALVRYQYWKAETALAYMHQIPDSKYRLLNLIEFFQQFPVAGEFKNEIIKEILRTIKMIQDNAFCASYIIPLIDKLPEILPEIFPLVEGIQDASTRAQLLIPLLDKLPEVKEEAIAAASDIQDEYIRIAVFVRLSDKIPELLPEILGMTESIRYDSALSRSLTLLSDKLPSEFLPNAFRIADKIQDKEKRIQALTALARSSTEIFPKILEAVEDFQNTSDPAPGIGVVTMYTDNLPSYLPSDGKPVTVLTILGKQMPSYLLPQALTIAESIQAPEERVKALTALIDRQPEVLSNALNAVEDIQDNQTYSQLVIGLVDKLLPDQVFATLPEIFRLVGFINDTSMRTKTLNKLTPLLLDYPDCSKIWKDFLHKRSFLCRPNLLSDLANMTSIIYALGAKEAIFSVVQATEDISRWWP